MSSSPPDPGLETDQPSAELPAYHHGNLRAALIEAGLAALEGHDRSELSLRGLARDVGVSANAAYRHFADKSALLNALAAEGFRRFTATLERAGADLADASERFRAAGRAYVRFACEHPALFRLMFSGPTTTGHDPELQREAGAAFNHLRQSAAAELGTAISEPRAALHALGCWALVHGLSHLALDDQLAPFGSDREALIDAVMRSLPRP